MTPKRSDHSEVQSAMTHTIRADYDWTAIPPSTAVIETVAVALDQEPTEITPLYDVIDPDALNTLIRSSDPDSVDDELTVTFPIAGQSVTVHGRGTVTIRPAEAGSDID